MTKIYVLRDSNPPFYEIPSFAPEEKIFHGFFGREGGLSTPPHDSLNCGTGSNDNPQTITENRKKVSGIIKIPDKNLLALYQIHSPICIAVTQPWNIENRPHADAAVTDLPNIGLSVLTADCAPILFYGKKLNNKPVIAAAHAGWRGALEGILESTTQAMQALGAATETIKTAIGPCISKKSYEVCAGFEIQFLKEDPESEKFFQSGSKENHLMFDLPGYCAWRLHRTGIKNIYLTDLDTYALEKNFFSYRRATHRKETEYGRQISVISIRSENN